MSVSMTWPEYLAGCCRIGGRLTRLRMQEADALAALLLCHPDRFVGLPDLAERAWPNADKQPKSAFDIFRVMVFRLRRIGVQIECDRQFGYRIPREARGREAMKLAA